MSAKALARVREALPSAFDDFFRPWNEWFNSDMETRMMTIPAVNVTEEKDHYSVSLAVPGLTRDDLCVDVDGNMMTISASKEEEKEEKEKKYTRKEYNYSSFSRTFTLPEQVDKAKIDAKYTDGVLSITLPKQAGASRNGGQKVAVK